MGDDEAAYDEENFYSQVAVPQRCVKDPWSEARQYWCVWTSRVKMEQGHPERRNAAQAVDEDETTAPVERGARPQRCSLKAPREHTRPLLRHCMKEQPGDLQTLPPHGPTGASVVPMRG